jgi:hypothetical protein
MDAPAVPFASIMSKVCTVGQLNHSFSALSNLHDPAMLMAISLVGGRAYKFGSEARR